MVKFSWVGGGSTALLTGTQVPRPLIGPIDFASDRAFLVLAVVALVVVSVGVIQLREGTIGRTLAALRGSEVAAASIGISAARARVVAFAVSAAIAGLGGALLSMHQQNVNYALNFAPVTALFWLVVVVALGSRTVEGAVFAGAAFALFEPLILQGELLGWIVRGEERLPDLWPISGNWRLILFGLMAMQFARHPEGLVEHGKRRSAARINRRLEAREGAAT
ncbi:MAG: ABC transporter permease, partial [Acidimicrobiaceae bacterium]|nr:ABC transporter permease [Acidimicrobiaceae bacterium]